MKVIKRFLIVNLIVLMVVNCATAKHLRYEKDYQKEWCDANKGVMEYVLDDNARVDCLTKDYAIEFDFANKWAESIGQTLYYAQKTGKKPAVALIIENPAKEQKYLRRLQTVAEKYGIRVFKIN